MAKVLSLFSGSLASRVATRAAENHEDVEVVFLLHLRSPFAEEHEELRQLVKDEWRNRSFRTQSLKREYRSLVQVPHGEAFSLVRSCFGCRYLLLKRAQRYMERIGAEYVVTGDRVGQNELTAEDLGRIERQAGMDGRVLRPLLHGDPLNGHHGLADWTNLERIHSGRLTGQDLVQLAQGVGLDPRDPVGSHRRCKLRVPGFGERVANLFGEVGFTLNALRLLDFTLYYKISPDTKLVIATDEQSKRELQNLFLPQDLRIYPPTPHGPMTLVRTTWEEKAESERETIIDLAARITATYIPSNTESPVSIYYRFENEDERRLLNVAPFASIEAIGALECVEVGPVVAEAESLVG